MYVALETEPRTLLFKWGRKKKNPSISPWNGRYNCNWEGIVEDSEVSRIYLVTSPQTLNTRA